MQFCNKLVFVKNQSLKQKKKKKNPPNFWVVVFVPWAHEKPVVEGEAVVRLLDRVPDAAVHFGQVIYTDGASVSSPVKWKWHPLEQIKKWREEVLVALPMMDAQSYRADR